MLNRVCRRGVAAVAVFSVAGLAAAGPTGISAQDLDTINTVMSLESSTAVHMDGPFLPGQRIVTAVKVGLEQWTFDLLPHSVRSDDYQVWHSDAEGNLTPVLPGPISTYRGSIVEQPDVNVTASVFRGGLILSMRHADGTILWMEPVGDRIAGATPQDYVLYDNADIIPSGATCGVNEGAIARDHGFDAANAVVTDGEEEGDDASAFGGTTYYTQLACDADYQYFLDYGDDTIARIESIINGVNSQYESNVDISHVISGVIVRTSPVYTSNNASTLLSQFRSRWQSQHGSVQRDVAHLFTGRGLNGGTIGIAYDIGAICTSGAYCLSESDCCGSFGCATDLTAHELGHLWNGFHCSCQNPNFTMNPFILCANNFSTATRNSIISHRNSRNCLSTSPPNQNGACCMPTGGCLPNSSTNCNAVGGTYQGNGTDCASIVCPDLSGACCLPDGTCDVIESGVCEAANGTYQGNASTCAAQNCAQPTSGGCCFPDGTCSVVFNYECLNGGGTYLGSGSSCAGVSCPQPSGACCLAGGLCLETDPTTCALAGGTYEGIDTTCAGASCEGTPCAGDVDGSGAVGFNDLVVILSSWGPCVACPADVDESGIVDFNDLVTVLSAWGPCP